MVDKQSRGDKLNGLQKKDKASLVDGTAIANYLNALQRFPQLKHPEMVELFQKYESGRTLGADGEVVSLTPEAAKIRTKLIECNLRLVVSIAKTYRNHNLPIEDLIQEGNIGLMKSIERFDWKRGFRFSTYSSWWIKQAIGQHVLKRKRMIRLPAHAATAQRKIIQASTDYRTQFGVDPTTEELVDLIGTSATVVKATQHSGRSIVSLQATASNSGEGQTWEDTVEDLSFTASPYNNVAEKQSLEKTREIMQVLPDKEQAILRLRFGLVEESTDHESYPITVSEMEQVSRGQGLV
jgi:RNA polymerase sigma factor (sigma-70 family)